MTPRLYAILDRYTLDAHAIPLAQFATELRDAGVTLLQYRDKTSPPQAILRAAEAIAEVFANTNATLILNDRADLAALLGWGVHVGQGDLSIPDALKLARTAGISTHTDAQVLAANATAATYIATGPVFATSTKLDAEPVIGLEGVRRARTLTTKPLIAIGGITHTNARSVIDAGADTIAVIGALLPADGHTTLQRTKQLLALLER